MSQKKKRAMSNEAIQFRSLFGPNANFTTTEAYKLLRTNVLFSFSSENACHIVGVTSSVRGEGKTTTSSNLCYSLSEMGKKVLLLECDLRIPSIPEKLQVRREPGLTNLLISRKSYKDFIQHSPLADDFDIITSGSFSPNPSELLGSPRMESVLKQMEQDYDYIIIDMPPILAVSDALVISRILHGIVLVVHKGIARRRELADTMRQLNLVSAKVLGFVFKDTSNAKPGYRKRYYKYNYGYYSSSSK